MTIHEFCRANPGLRPEQFEILASDISPSALFLAKAGRYDEAALSRGLPAERRAGSSTRRAASGWSTTSSSAW